MTHPPMPMYRRYAAAVPSIPIPQPYASGPPSGWGMPMICTVSDHHNDSRLGLDGAIDLAPSRLRPLQPASCTAVRL